MPIERHLNPTTQILETTISGRVTIDDLHEHFRAVHDMGGQVHPEVIDARMVVTLSFGAKDLPRLAELGRQLFSKSYTAPRAVIVNGVMYFGMARLFASFAAPWVRVAVFENRPAAESWLDLIARITQV